MTRLGRLVLIVLFAIIGSLADPQCGDNEYLDNCPVDCAADYCPKSEEEALQGCPPAPNPCAPPACKCRFNTRHVSANNKTCIPTRECPPFACNRPNEEFNACPPYCPSDTCSQATPDGNCPRLFGRIGIVLMCSPKCRCIKNYWRQDGVCIPYAECPQNQAPAAVAAASVETPISETRVPETPAPETPVPETPAPETPVPETPAPETPVPETPAPETPVPKTPVPESPVPDTPIPESSASGPSATQAEPDNTPQGDISYTEYKSPYASAYAESSDECVSSLDGEICSGPNEEYVLEKQTCPPEFCYAITARINCTDAPPPQPGCACKTGFFRLNATEPCIGICDCPQMAYSPDCLGIFY